jgi:hypothetical protein
MPSQPFNHNPSRHANYTKPTVIKRVALDTEQLAQLERASLALNLTEAQVFRLALEEYCENHLEPIDNSLLEENDGQE